MEPFPHHPLDDMYNLFPPLDTDDFMSTGATSPSMSEYISNWPTFVVALGQSQVTSLPALPIVVPNSFIPARDAHLAVPVAISSLATSQPQYPTVLDSDSGSSFIGGGRETADHPPSEETSLEWERRVAPETPRGGGRSIRGGGGSIKPFGCTTCGKSYTAKHNLQYHLDYKHRMLQKKIECQYCGKRFTAPRAHVRHLKNRNACPQSPQAK
ncbi:hypothetical protein BT96DRAFT_969660 [Gymnopus androsaceus JB14]|uniref:C2H2-type domain-containing protein n=1 Tax=Gymnopus androsaceus JB14 TaxID=1447944 RepID=A0A6A4ILZ2_9AGAR|nr:hypothetical protein BT96DRAFT_969660 [Gymnopus androsaceus JB14]